jgi:hypothetical protein
MIACSKSWPNNPHLRPCPQCHDWQCGARTGMVLASQLGWAGHLFLTPDACLAVQAQPGPSPSHSAAAAQSDKLASLRGRLASAQQSHGLVYRRGDRVWAAAPRTTRGGQPFYSPPAILTALTLRAVFCLAYPQTEGLIGSIISLLGLTLRMPDPTTLSRCSATQAVPRPSANGVNAGDGSRSLHLLVDSTGLTLCGAGEWLIEKHGTRTRPSWRTLHLGVDADTGHIVAAALTNKEVDEAAQVGPLLDQLSGS